MTNPLENIETDYETVVSNGEVQRKKGRHGSEVMCDCDFSNTLGEYRDVTVLYKSREYIFYHNTAIVIKTDDGFIRLSNGGWGTKSTKQRINLHIPSGYKVYQEQGDWYISTPDGDIDFYQGIALET